MFIEGSLEVKLPTIWTDEKQRWEVSEKRREEERERVRRKKIQEGSGGSKSRLAKAAGAELGGRMRDEKLHAVVARSTFRSKHVQNTPFSDQFWKLRCRKSARRCGASTFRSQNVKSTRGLDQFWKLRCRKSARPCGPKHISKLM